MSDGADLPRYRRPWEYKEGDRVKVSMRVSAEDTADPVTGKVLVIDEMDSESYIFIGFDDGRPAQDVHFTRVQPLIEEGQDA